MAIDVKFLTHIGKDVSGRDIDATMTRNFITTEPGTIKYGRGAVLTVTGLTAANMMCDPCVHGRQPGWLCHELSMDEIREILIMQSRSSRAGRCRWQFSGGEPRFMPNFIEAIKYARKLVTTASGSDQRNRVRQEQRCLSRSAEAGLRTSTAVDGVGNDAIASQVVICST